MCGAPDPYPVPSVLGLLGGSPCPDPEGPSPPAAAPAPSGPRLCPASAGAGMRVPMASRAIEGYKLYMSPPPAAAPAPDVEGSMGSCSCLPPVPVPGCLGCPHARRIRCPLMISLPCRSVAALSAAALQQVVQLQKMKELVPTPPTS
jgi:hypothetical protein